MDVEVRDSKIHGKGLFAKKLIPKGKMIVEYIGHEMSWKDFTNKYGSYKMNSLNTYPMRRIWRIIVAKEEPYKSSNLVNMINEGEANCVLKKRGLWSCREIEEGEELLLKYPKDYEREWIKIPCT